MKKEILNKCPVCSSRIIVTKMECTHCETELSGRFELTKFDYLSQEQRYFVEVFIKNRGNIKEIEKELGISYPTVRRTLDNVIEALGYKTEPQEPKINKKEILEKLSKGEITADEALSLLKEK